MGNKYILAIFSIVLIVSTTFAEEWKNEGFSEKINCIANFKDKIYAGTDNGLLVIESTSGKKVLYNKSNSGIVDNKVSHLAVDKQGRVWAASSNYGLSTFDGSKWKVFLTPTNDKRITALSVDGQGVASVGYQVACPEGHHCNPGNAQVLKFKAEKESTFFPPCNGAILSMFSDGGTGTYLLRDKFLVKVGPEFNILEVNIVVDSPSDMLLMNDKVWVATSKGLKVYQNKTFTTVDKSNSPLPDNDVKRLFTDANNNMFVITSSALVQKSKENWKSYPLSELPSSQVSGVLTDAEGKIWIGTSNGLFTKTPELQVSSDTEDGHSFVLPTEDATIQGKMQIYPNPSNGRFNIEVPDKYNTLAVFNGSGNLVHTQAVTARLEDVSLMGLAKGVYHVQLASGKSHLDSKILIE